MEEQTEETTTNSPSVSIHPIPTDSALISCVEVQEVDSVEEYLNYILTYI